MLPLDLPGPLVGVLLLCCCGFAGSRDGLCFFSGIGGGSGSNMRYVPGGVCLVGAARPRRNKLLHVFVHLVAMHSGGGGGSVRFELLASVDPAKAMEGVGSCIGALARHLLPCPLPAFGGAMRAVSWRRWFELGLLGLWWRREVPDSKIRRLMFKYRVLLAAIQGLESDLCSGGYRQVVCSCGNFLGEGMMASSVS